MINKIKKYNLQEFAKKLENLSWDDFMTIYENRSLYTKDQQLIINEENNRRCNDYNKYMSF